MGAIVEAALIRQIYAQHTYVEDKNDQTQAITCKAVQAALRQSHDIFHFTGHGAYNSRNPAESCLFLSGTEQLTLMDIIDLDLSSYRLVCLAACETAVTGNQTISDASWYSLKLKTKYQASKLGNRVAEINPRKTSQECSQCGYVSPNNRDGEKFVCEACGHHTDADIDAGIVIGKRGLEIFKLGSTQLLAVSQKVTPKPELTGSRKGNKSLPLAGESGNPKQVHSVQLSLFDLLEWSSG